MANEVKDEKKAAPAKAAVKTEKPAVKAETKPAPKAEVKPAAAKAPLKAAPKAETAKSAAKPAEVKPAPKSEAKPAVSAPAPKAEVKPEVKAAAAKTETKSEPKSETKPAAKADIKTAAASTPAAKSDVKPAAEAKDGVTRVFVPKTAPTAQGAMSVASRPSLSPQDIRVKRNAAKIKMNGTNATGRRKKSIARVRIVPGKGNVIINCRPLDEYFVSGFLRLVVNQPLVTADIKNFDVLVNVLGGGLTGQAGAIRHGIARALVKDNALLKPELKKEGFLKRDPRMKERKKYGLKKARKAPQFSKR